MIDEKIPPWAKAAKLDRSIIKGSLEYWKQDVKDSVHYTDEEKMIFVLMDCLARAKEVNNKRG